MKSLLIYFILASTLILSCKEIFFNEDERTRELDLDDFHAVRIKGIYNIVLIQDSAYRLVITGKNDINTIEAVIRNDTLIIDDHKKMSFNPNKNTLTLHFGNLKQLVTYDPVNLSNTDTLKANLFVFDAIGEIEEVSLVIKCNSFLFSNSANTLGFFHFKGIAASCMFFNRYGSTIFADSLFCKNAEIYNESIGDVHVNSSEKIKAYIWGPGNIYYHGTPLLEIAEKRGDGKLIRAD
jgi:hypothetical protein